MTPPRTATGLGTGPARPGRDRMPSRRGSARTGAVNASIALGVSVVVAAALLLGRFDGDITGFFWVGGELPLSPYLAEDSVRINDGAGYDGQMFLTVALDPALRHPGSRAALDNPRYRYGRIGYPILGHVMAFGRPAAIPWALVLINVVASAGLVLLGTGIAGLDAGTGSPPRSSVLLLAAPGVWVALCLSTADLLGAALLLAGCLAVRRNRDTAAAVSLGAACLVRETYLASVLALSIFRYAGGRGDAARKLAVAAIPSLAWLAYVRLTLGGGTGGVRENLGFPGAGIVASVGNAVRREISPAGAFESYCLGLLLAAALVVLADAWMMRRRWTPEQVAVLPFVALLIFSRPQVLEYHGGYLRAFLPVLLVPNLTPRDEGFSRGKKVVILLGLAGSVAYVFNMVVP